MRRDPTRHVRGRAKRGKPAGRKDGARRTYPSSTPVACAGQLPELGREGLLLGRQCRSHGDVSPGRSCATVLARMLFLYSVPRAQSASGDRGRGAARYLLESLWSSTAEESLWSSTAEAVVSVTRVGFALRKD